MQAVTLFFKKHTAPLLLLLVFALCELVVNPMGEFPLNDDWWYARLYYSLSGILPNDSIQWPSAAYAGQYLLARGTSLLFGHSLVALRLSCIVAAALVLWLLYKITRLNQSSSGAALIVAFCILANPVFLCLGNSFMSDVPFILYVMGATYCLFVFLETRSNLYLTVSVLCYTLAILTRQVAAVLVVAAAVTTAFAHKKTGKAAWFLVVLFVLFVFEFLLHNSGKDTSYAYIFLNNPGNAADAPAQQVIFNYARRWVHYASFTAFSLSPLLLPYLMHKLWFTWRNFSLKVLVPVLVLSLPVWYSLKNFPIGNYLYNLGVGPETLYDTYLAGINSRNMQSNFLFYLLRAITAVCVPALFLAGIRAVNTLVLAFRSKACSQNLYQSLYLLLSMSAYYFLMCHRDAIFDRYMILFVVLALLFLHQEIVPARFHFIRIGLIGLLTAFSVFATRDYFTSNRTRWQAIDFLKHNYKVPPEEINAGYEYAGYVLGQSPNWYRHWQNTPPSGFLLAHGPVPGYTTFTCFNYYRSLSFTTDTIYILKHNALHLN